jgi:hypothetical protein
MKDPRSHSPMNLIKNLQMRNGGLIEKIYIVSKKGCIQEKKNPLEERNT